MKANYYLLLVFPVCIMFAGFLVLYGNLVPARSLAVAPSTLDSVISVSAKFDTVQNGNGRSFRQTNTRTTTKRQSVERPGVQDQKDPGKALPFFILSSVLMIVILALPRLSELSVSERSIVLKLFDEVKSAASDLQDGDTPPGAEAERRRASNARVLRLNERIDLLEKVLKRKT